MPDASVPQIDSETAPDASRAAWEAPEVRRLSASASELNIGAFGDTEGVS